MPGEKMPTFAEVFHAVKESGRSDIGLNVKTKISPIVPMTPSSLQYFTLRESRRLDPKIEAVALVWQYGPRECGSLADECSLRAVYNDPSVKSPWTAPQDWWQERDLGMLVQGVGASTVSSNWQFHDPNQGTVVSEDWYLRENPAYYHGPTVPDLQDPGLEDIPYTINDAPTMQRGIDPGVDGIITDDHELLIVVAKRNGLR